MPRLLTLKEETMHASRVLRAGSLYAAVAVIALMCLLITPTATADFVGFDYDPVTDPILSATFSGDFAALTAHRTVAGYEMNFARLIAVTTGLPSLDLSDDLFGTAAWPEPALVDQGAVETGWVSANIDPAFFPALESGQVGLSFLFTDTDDALFAIDTLILTIETGRGTVESYYGWPIGAENNGFGLDIPDGGDLPAPMPGVLDPTGTGFDEEISSKSPEPSTLALLTCGLIGLLSLRRRRERLGSAPAWRRPGRGGIGKGSAVGLLLLLAVQSVPVSAGVLLNEIMYHEIPGDPEPLRDHEWVEIYNPGPGDVDLTGWVITDREGLAGAAARLLPSVVLPEGCYLIVHFTVGVDDLDLSDCCGEYYTQDVPPVDLLDNSMDECALYDAAEDVVDFVAWNYGAIGYTPGTAHDDAVALAEWTEGLFLNTKSLKEHPREKVRRVKPGQPIGRDKDSTDTNRPEDWDAQGGKSAAGRTPCRRNFDHRPFLVFNGGAPPAPKEWTVMVYVDGDDGLLEKYAYLDLKEMELAGGSDDNVNVVVQVDGLNTLVQVFEDAFGNLITIPNTQGGTWRFLVGPEVDTRYVRAVTHGGDDPFLGSPDDATPPDVNMGDPASLSSFIAWAKMRYPAQKYALILWDHGLGWKGCCWDATSPGLFDTDGLMMGELTAALAGHNFELIGFDQCLMGMIEVAYQVEPFSNYMVASEEVESVDGWPYDLWLPALKANPGWGGAALGSQIVSDYHFYYTAVSPDDIHTLSCVDQAVVPALVNSVSSFGTDLKAGCDDFKVHDDPADNVEHRIAVDSAATERYADGNYMDLHHFATLICADLVIPLDCDQCYKVELPTLLPLSVRLGPVVIAEEHGPGRPNANGLSIYMPLLRTTWFTDAGDPSDPYDYPSASRLSDGDSQRAMYAPNVDCLPFQGRDVELFVPLPAPPEWPLLPAPGFRFPTDTAWDEFLQRFYHPVADNHIEKAVCPDGFVIFPHIDDPECGNPVDEIWIPCGCTVEFHGFGSSDADTPDQLPVHWMWDFDHLINGCAACIAPYEVPPFVDAATADDDMNADQDCDKAPLDDEKEADATIVFQTYFTPRVYVIHLHTWDDNHLFPFHNTDPSADYVHTQTDTHPSIVHVICPDQLHLLGPIPNDVPVGGEGSIDVSVQDSFTGVEGAHVVATGLVGDFSFVDGVVAGGEHSITVITDADGTASVRFLAEGVGLGLIQFKVGGTALVAYSFFEIVEEPPPPAFRDPAGGPDPPSKKVGSSLPHPWR